MISAVSLPVHLPRVWVHIDGCYALCILSVSRTFSGVLGGFSNFEDSSVVRYILLSQVLSSRTSHE